MGAPVREALRRYGGDRWVMIPTASADFRIRLQPPKWMGPGALVLHTRDHRLANSEGFVKPLYGATAVFFGGGRQYRLVDAYAGTLTELAIRGVLSRGGLIAGTSAGATIQGSYLVRGAPSEYNRILMYPGYEHGFGYLSNVAIDQHVDVRNRVDDLTLVIARYPTLLGIGLDQGTGIFVERNILTVLGPDRVYITQANQPLFSLTPRMQFDIATRRKV